MEAHNTTTVKLTKTIHASRDEYYMKAGQECHCCDNEAVKIVGVNASKGQRKTQELCDDCLADFEEAPKGIYDPVVIAKKE